MIDFHMHAYPDHLAKRVIGNLSERFNYHLSGDGTITDVCRVLNETGVDKGVILPIASRPEHQKHVNDFAAGVMGRLLYAFGSLHPYAADIEDEMKRIMELGLRGVKFHPHYQGYDINDPKAVEAYMLCVKMDMPFLIHCGKDTGHPGKQNASYDKTIQIIPHIEGSKAILAHLAVNGEYDLLDDRVLGRDVYMDTAMLQRFSTEQISIIVKKHGANKLIFGSDYPFGFPGEQINILKNCEIDADELSLIMEKNAQVLLASRL